MFMFALQPEPEAGRRCRVLVPGALLTAVLFWTIGTMSRSASLRLELPTATTIRVQVSLPEAVPGPVPEPEPKPEAPPEPTPPKAKEKPIAAPKAPPKEAEPRVDASAESLPAATEPSQVAPPLLGLTPESTSALAAGPALPLGNTMLAGVHSVARPSRVSSGPRGAVSPAGRETTSKRRTEPKLQSSVLPDYPSEAKRAGVEGVVILLLNIDARGLVQSVRVLKGLGHGLDESAVRAAKQTRWQPATLGPNAVQSTRAFNVRFSLQS